MIQKRVYRTHILYLTLIILTVLTTLESELGNKNLSLIGLLLIHPKMTSVNYFRVSDTDLGAY